MNNDDEDITQSRLLQQVSLNTKGLKELAVALEDLREENAPVREFFSDMATAARFGRTARAVIGWTVVVVAGLAFAWNSFLQTVVGK